MRTNIEHLVGVSMGTFSSTLEVAGAPLIANGAHPGVGVFDAVDGVVVDDDA